MASKAGSSSESANGTVAAIQAIEYNPISASRHAAASAANADQPNRTAVENISNNVRTEPTNNAGIKCLREANARCLRITTTFQKPYCKYWRKRAAMEDRGV